MPPPPAPGMPNPASSMVGRMASPLVEIRKRAQVRLNERVDPARSRGKPLSLLKQEAKRVLEQFFDAEAPALAKPERDKIIEEMIGDAIGYGPLEELFKDADIKEIIALQPTVVIVRKNDNWMPSHVRFRDAAHLKAVLAKMSEAGENLVPTPAATGGFDLRISNGFRVVAVVPPDVMDQPPMVLFIRGAGTGSGVAPASGIMAPKPGPPSPTASGILATPPPRNASGTIPMPTSGRPLPPNAGTGSGVGTRPIPQPSPAAGMGSGIVPIGELTPPPSSGSMSSTQSVTGSQSSANTDPLVRVRQKVTERIIMKLAAAGVYDLNVIPLTELRKIAMAYVIEYLEGERVQVDPPTVERLAGEILAGMNR
jgi:hypothetical protein